MDPQKVQNATQVAKPQNLFLDHPDLTPVLKLLYYHHQLGRKMRRAGRHIMDKVRCKRKKDLTCEFIIEPVAMLPSETDHATEKSHSGTVAEHKSQDVHQHDSISVRIPEMRPSCRSAEVRGTRTR